MNLTLNRAASQALPRLRPTRATESGVTPTRSTGDGSPTPSASNEPMESCEISFGKKATNTGVWTVAGAAVGAASTLLLASAIGGPAALGAFLLAPVLAGVGAIAGGVAGWKMLKRPEGSCEASTAKKAVNSGAWGIAGATTGVAATLLAATAIAGPSALGALIFAPLLAAGGAIAGGVAGWRMMGN